MNLLFDLPKNLQEQIFELDPTYYEIFNMCILELNLNFQQYQELNKLLRNFYRQKAIFHHYADLNFNYLLN